MLLQLLFLLKKIGPKAVGVSHSRLEDTISPGSCVLVNMSVLVNEVIVSVNRKYYTNNKHLIKSAPES